jgi:protein SCO1/2
MKHLQEVHAALAERMGKDIWIVSVTVDPEHDTPEALKAYAEKFGAGAGWSLLTGTKEQVARALKSFGHETEDPKRHRNVLLIGKESTGQWRNVDALIDPMRIKDVIVWVSAAEPLKLPAASAPR